MAASVGEREGVERGHDLLGPAGGRRRRGCTTRCRRRRPRRGAAARPRPRRRPRSPRGRPPASDSTIAAVAAQPDSSHTNRCQSTSSAGTTLPRGPTAAIDDPTGASVAQRAPGTVAVHDEVEVDGAGDCGSARRIGVAPVDGAVDGAGVERDREHEVLARGELEAEQVVATHDHAGHQRRELLAGARPRGRAGGGREGSRDQSVRAARRCGADVRDGARGW